MQPSPTPQLSPRPFAQERRNSPRVGADIEARLSMAGAGLLPCRVRNIGYGGACLEVASTLAISEVTRLDLMLASGRVVSAPAKGRWTRPATLEDSWLMGVQFGEMADEERNLIHRSVHDAIQAIIPFLVEEAGIPGVTVDDAMDITLATNLCQVATGTYVSLHPSEYRWSDSLYLILAGDVVIEAGSRRPPRFEVRLGRGDAFGGYGLVTDLPVPLAAVTASETLLLEVATASLSYLTRAKPLAAEGVRRLIINNAVRYFGAALERLDSDGEGR